MKIALAFFFSLVLGLPLAKAEEHTFPDPMQQMGQLLQCEAVNVTLSHLHSQIAASMTGLSGPEGSKLTQPMVNGYRMMAEADEAKNGYISKVIKEAVVPQLLSAGMPEDMIKQGGNKLLSKAILDMAIALGNPKHDFDDQVDMEKLLAEQSGKCDSLAAQVEKAYTF